MNSLHTDATAEAPPGVPAGQYFTAACQTFICTELAKCRGQELLLGGKLDGTGRVQTLDVLARGNKRMVPAVIETARGYDVVVHNHPSALLTPSAADLHAAGVLSDYRVGFYIITNDCTRVNVVTRSGKAPQKRYQLDAARALQYLDTESSLAKALPGYVYRESQARLMRGVVQAFNKDAIYLAEAPTGTGKSLAYLLPALLWARQTRHKVVISTHTILLQEQLLKKDIPLLKRLSGLADVKVELVKGRQHYLCYRKYAQLFGAGQLGDLFSATERESPRLSELADWGAKSSRGEFRELSFDIHRTPYKEELCCEADTCKHSLCQHQHDGKCFYGAARKRFSEADILIVNHHVLMIDLFIKAEQGMDNPVGLLPGFKYLIVDEAHHLDEVALKHSGVEATRWGILKTLRQLLTVPRVAAAGAAPRAVPRGVLVNLQNKLNAAASAKLDPKVVTSEQQTAAQTLLKRLRHLVEKYKQAQTGYVEQETQLFEQLYNYLRRTQSHDGNVQAQAAGGNQKSVMLQQRIRAGMPEEADWKLFAQPLNELLTHLAAVDTALQDLHKLLQGIAEPLLNSLELGNLRTDFSAYYTRLDTQFGTFRALLQIEKKGEAKWLSATRHYNRLNVSAHQYNIDIAERLAQACLQPLQTVVLTSATLTVENSFDFLRTRLGIRYLSETQQQRVQSEQLATHFDYAAHCGFYLPGPDFPAVQAAGFTQAAQTLLLTLLKRFPGRMLILFTSHRAMELMYTQLVDALRQLGIKLMMQGRHERYAMLAEMERAAAQTVLLGVDSFWEGIDLRDKQLTCLVMMKLPFPNVGDPLIAARLEFLEQDGRNSFTEFSLPKAILRYRQGFGRLLRGEQERGLFVLLDKRVRTQAYGRRFMASLPQLYELKHPTALAAAEAFWKLNAAGNNG